MGLSKKDLQRKKANLKNHLDELEAKAVSDPLKRNTAMHEEIAQLKKKIAESD